MCERTHLAGIKPQLVLVACRHQVAKDTLQSGRALVGIHLPAALAGVAAPTVQVNSDGQIDPRILHWHGENLVMREIPLLSLRFEHLDVHSVGGTQRAAAATTTAAAAAADAIILVLFLAQSDDFIHTTNVLQCLRLPLLLKFDNPHLRDPPRCPCTVLILPLLRSSRISVSSSSVMRSESVTFSLPSSHGVASQPPPHLSPPPPVLLLRLGFETAHSNRHTSNSC